MASPTDKISNFALWSFLDDIKNVLSKEDQEYIRKIGMTTRGNDITPADRDRLLDIMCTTISRPLNSFSAA